MVKGSLDAKVPVKTPVGVIVVNTPLAVKVPTACAVPVGPLIVKPDNVPIVPYTVCRPLIVAE